jgi:hypothetical protein
VHQVRLQRAHAEHEEAAEADGHQDHARLIARPRQADRVTDGEPLRSRQGRRRADEQPAPSSDRQDEQAGGDKIPEATRPARFRDDRQRADRRGARGALQLRWRADVACPRATTAAA